MKRLSRRNTKIFRLYNKLQGYETEERYDMLRSYHTDSVNGSSL